jgi:flagellar protein FliL
VADEAKTPVEGTTEAPPAKGKGGLMTVLMLVASLAVGGSVGFVVIGPRFAASPGNPAGEDGDGHGAGKKEGHEGGGADSPLYDIENLVVNPAGTQGTRFLVVSIAIQLADASGTTMLRDREPEVRDALLHLFSSKTVEQLSNLASRDSLKADIATTLDEVLGKDMVVKVFVPQFVLQ